MTLGGIIEALGVKAYYQDNSGVILQGDTLEMLRKLPDELVQMCVTSPPYFGLRNYSIEPTVWGGDKNCPHEWELYETGFEPFALKGKMTIIDKLRKGDTISDIEMKTIASCLGINSRVEINIPELRNKPIKERFTATTKRNSPPFADRTISIQNTPNKIGQKPNRDSGECNSKAFPGNDTKLNQSVPQIDRPQMKSPVSSLDSDIAGGRDFRANKIDKFKITGNEADVSIVSDATISNQQTKDISQVMAPSLKKPEINNMFSPEKFTPTREITKANWITSELPSRAIDNLTAKSAHYHLASSSIRSGEFPPVHKTIICQKCGAVKCCLGLEPSPDLYIDHLVTIFRELRRVLKKDGTLWLNISDSYNGGGRGGRDKNPKYKQSTNKGSTTMPACNIDPNLKPKNLFLIPERLLIALQADGWTVRQRIIWAKGLSFCKEYSGSVMPESVTDRCTNAFEFVYMLSKSKNYYYDNLAFRDSGSPGATNFASFGSSALAPEGNATLDTNNVTADFRGRLDFINSQYSIIGSMTSKTKDFKIIKSIRYKIVGEEPEWDFMVNLQAGFGTASLASITSFFKSLSPDDSPIRTTIINASSFISRVFNPNQMFTSPFTGACSITETMFKPRQILADMIHKNITAFITFEGNPSFPSLSIFGTLTPSHIDHNNINTKISQGRNLRNVWVIQSEPTSFSHFATFPTALVKPCVLLGSSQKGQCRKCGANWVRVVEKSGGTIGKSWHDHNNDISRGQRVDANMRDKINNGTYKVQTLGWRPTCECNAETEPNIIMDCFSGTATVGYVAKNLNRRYVMNDISEKYNAYARQRLAQEVLQ